MMKYDQLGFPIPTDFGPLTDDGNDQGPGRPGGRRRTAGPGKRLFLLAVFLTLLVPAVIVPVMMPAIREAVVQWSLERAIMREGRGSLDAAIGDLSRAIRWAGGNDAAPPALSRLLCWRAMLRIENRDAGGGLADADQAAAVAPTTVQPHRIRALAHVVLGDAGISKRPSRTSTRPSPTTGARVRNCSTPGAMCFTFSVASRRR